MAFDKKKNLKDRPVFQKYNHDNGKQSLTVPAWLSNYCTKGRSPQYLNCFPKICLWHY